MVALDDETVVSLDENGTLHAPHPTFGDVAGQAVIIEGESVIAARTYFDADVLVEQQADRAGLEWVS
jgi:hypothetical protein